MATLAWILGATAALATDPLVLLPAIAVGALGRPWRRFLWLAPSGAVLDHLILSWIVVKERLKFGLEMTYGESLVGAALPRLLAFLLLAGFTALVVTALAKMYRRGAVNGS